MTAALYIVGALALLYAVFWSGVYLGQRGRLRAWWPGWRKRVE